MISIAESFELFGIPGLILITLGTSIYFFNKNYQLNIITDEIWSNNIPSRTLDENWENVSDSSVRESHGNCYNRMTFGTKQSRDDIEFVWNIDMCQNKGNVYLYRNLFEEPSKQNNGNHFLRIKIVNLPENASVYFQKKSFRTDDMLTGAWRASIDHPRLEDQPINKDGIHIFEPKCLIGKDDVKKEQIGIFFDSHNIDFHNTMIQEAYYGVKCWIYRLNFCKYKMILQIIPKVKGE